MAHDNLTCLRQHRATAANTPARSMPPRLPAIILSGFLSLSALALAPCQTAIARDSHTDFLRKNVIYFLRHSAVTAHIQIENFSISKHFGGFGPNGRTGYIKFRVSATVIESFKGTKPGKLEFYVTQEQPSDPPDHGEYIVSLKRDRDGTLFFADDSVLWIEATPVLLEAARKRK